MLLIIPHLHCLSCALGSVLGTGGTKRMQEASELGRKSVGQSNRMRVTEGNSEFTGQGRGGAGKGTSNQAPCT